MNILHTYEYGLIDKFYNFRRAERSRVFLMNHIDEGIKILSRIGASEEAARAFCLHPLFQNDKDLFANFPTVANGGMDPYVVMLAMEYRSVANEYLSHREISDINEIRLSPINEVNEMLIADKVQNRKDFIRYHEKTHERSAELHWYFQNWLWRLGITEDLYADLTEGL